MCEGLGLSACLDSLLGASLPGHSVVGFSACAPLVAVATHQTLAVTLHLRHVGFVPEDQLQQRTLQPAQVILLRWDKAQV